MSRTRGVRVFKSFVFPFVFLRQSETSAMESTIQPDMKLADSTDKSPSISTTGFTMMPPPIPVIAPTVDALMAVRKRRTAFKVILPFPKPK